MDADVLERFFSMRYVCGLIFQDHRLRNIYSVRNSRLISLFM